MSNLLCTGPVCMNTTKYFVPLHNDTTCMKLSANGFDIMVFEACLVKTVLNKNAFQKDAYRPLFTVGRGGISLTEIPPGHRPPLDRDPSWIETPLDRDPPGQRPPDREPPVPSPP